MLHGTRTLPPRLQDNPVRQKLIQELHEQLLKNEEVTPALTEPPTAPLSPLPTAHVHDNADGVATPTRNEAGE